MESFRLSLESISEQTQRNAIWTGSGASRCFSPLRLFYQRLDFLFTLHQRLVVLFRQEDALLRWSGSSVVQLCVLANANGRLSAELGISEERDCHFRHVDCLSGGYRNEPAILVVKAGLGTRR